MNDFDVASRGSTASALAPPAAHAAAAARLLTRRTHPARAVDITTPDSGPALTRDFRTRLLWSDLAAVLVATLAATAVSISTLYPGASTAPSASSAPATVPAAAMQAASVQQLGLLLLVVAGWIASLWVFRTRESRVLCVGVTEYRRVVSATTMTFGILGIALGIAQVDDARNYFLLAFPAGLLALVLERWLWRRWLARRSLAGKALSRVVIVGNREDVTYVVDQVRRKLGLAYAVVGAVIEEGNLDGASFGMSSLPTSNDLDNVSVTAAQLGADAVIVAGSLRNRSNYVQELSWSLEGTATDLILATSLANVAGPRIHLRPVEGLPLIHVEVPQFEGGRHALKRGFDIAVAGTAILVLAPLLLLVALIIRLDSPGPVLFRQERVGRDGSKFTMLKFRSMVVTAEDELAALRQFNEGAGALFKIRDDPRVTRVGRFIRKHSIDELPQLWNIVIGDMSVVGPRPPLPSEVLDYEEHVHRRLYIRPGLTGMWQVNGRSTLDWEESVKIDLFYVENWSLVGDIVIMWRTLREVRTPIGGF